jgi:hypothetical protein
MARSLLLLPLLLLLLLLLLLRPAECKQCYTYHMQVGDTCANKLPTDSCWAAAKLGFCAMQDALQSSYALNVTQVSWRWQSGFDCIGCCRYCC